MTVLRPSHKLPSLCSLYYSSVLNKQYVPLETPLAIYQIIPRHILAKSNFHNHNQENFKFHTISFISTFHVDSLLALLFASSPAASKNCFGAIRIFYPNRILIIQFNSDISIIGIHSASIPKHDISQMLKQIRTAQ